jgi:hypothetical protein
MPILGYNAKIERQGGTMYPDAEEKLTAILSLVGKCPEKLQDKCFGMLLEAYLASKVVSLPAAATPVLTPIAPPIGNHGAVSVTTGLPDSLKNRFVSQASRAGLSVGKLAALFDFHVDPYNYHAIAMPGDTKAHRIRNAGLLLCAKTYLVSLGGWTADWKEFRAVCIDQGCWDQANASTHLGKSGYFKTMSATDGLELTSAGIEAAQTVLGQLAGTSNDSADK